MAHELDMTRGQAAIAFRGAVPWHGLGAEILPQDSLDDIRIKAGLDYDVVKTPVQYTQAVPLDAVAITGDQPIDEDFMRRQSEALRPAPVRTSKDKCVLYRSDTGDDLSVVSTKYQVVQPSQVVNFYRSLTEQYGFQVEVVGALKGGRKVWALANTGNCINLPGEDRVKGYLLLATSYDGTMATQARFTSIRVVCNNTLTLANSEGRPDVSVPHSATFDEVKVKQDLGLGNTWSEFAEQANHMVDTKRNNDDFARMLLSAYYGLTTERQISEFQMEDKNNTSFDKLVKRITTALNEAPGAHLAAARDTLWGALQAVTYDVDHQLPSHSVDTRLDKAWFGTGDNIKRRAYDFARGLVVL